MGFETSHSPAGVEASLLTAPVASPVGVGPLPVRRTVTVPRVVDEVAVLDLGREEAVGPVAVLVHQGELGRERVELAADLVDDREGLDLLQAALVELVGVVVQAGDALPVVLPLVAVEAELEVLEPVAPELSLLGLGLEAAVLADRGLGAVEQVAALGHPLLELIEVAGHVRRAEGPDEDPVRLGHGRVDVEAPEPLLQMLEGRLQDLALGPRPAAQVAGVALAQEVVGDLDDAAAGGGGGDVAVVGVHGWLHWFKGGGREDAPTPDPGEHPCSESSVRWGSASDATE